MRTVIVPSRAPPCRGTSANDGALPLRKYLATMLIIACDRDGVMVPNGRSPSRAYTLRSKGPSPGMSVSTITSTSVAGTTQPDAALTESSERAIHAVRTIERNSTSQCTRTIARFPTARQPLAEVL